MTVPNVVGGAPITPAWGNNVADDINAMLASIAVLAADVAAVPLGVIAYRVGTASAYEVNADSATDITVTAGQAPSIAALTLDTARRYRATFLAYASMGPASAGGTNPRAVFDLYRDATVVATFMGLRPANSPAADALWVVYFNAPDTAAHTWKVRGRVIDATAMSFAQTSATHPVQFTIEDAGPA